MESGAACLSRRHNRLNHDDPSVPERGVWDTGCPTPSLVGGGPSPRTIRLAGSSDVSREVVLSDEPPSALAAKLVAAKPVSWRGCGDLCQVTWAPVLRGTWLVLDLWAGVSGLCIALLQLGMHFYGLAAECDEQARRVASTNMPSLVHCDRVEAIQATDLVPILRRRRFRGILMGGGSPCQGNSSLNRQRRGLDDERGCQPVLLAELRQAIQALPEAEGLEILSFLENVQSMLSDVCAQYSSWMGGDPVAIRAGSCGWVTRNRLYWLVSRSRSISAGMTPPDDWEWEDGVTPPVLSFCGKKPLPQKVHFQQGFQPLFSPTDVMQQKGEGAMHTFALASSTTPLIVFVTFPLKWLRGFMRITDGFLQVHIQMHLWYGKETPGEPSPQRNAAK